MRVIIAGGGTGGHLFPGIAVAQELLARGGEVLFVGTEQGLEARVLPRVGLDLRTIRVRGLTRVSWTERFRFLFEAPVAAAQTAAVLARFRPQVVVGVGGYSSGPVVLEAALARLPTVILEQNSVPGVTNRLLGRVATRIFCAFEDAVSSFPDGRAEVLGNPVRRDIVTAIARSNGGRQPPADGRLGLFVFGGSQGARGINERFMEAAPALARLDLRLTHQTGEADLERVREAYAAAGLEAEVTPFISNMARRYAEADLIVCRAGATTLAELAIAGRPAVLVPYPYAAHNHQERNAREFERRGAALCQTQDELDGPGLARLVAELAGDVDRRRAMGRAMRGLAREDAARVIASRIWDLARGGRRP